VPTALPLAGLRLGVIQDYVLAGLDAGVAQAFEQALIRLSRAGARLSDVRFAALGRLPHINRHGGMVMPEAYAIHRTLIAARRAGYDPRVASRVLRGAEVSAADYIDVQNERRDDRRERAHHSPFRCLADAHGGDGGAADRAARE